MAVAAVQIPGYVAGKWAIDPVHTDISFVARHMMVSKVRGHFTKYEGEIVTAEDPQQSSVAASVDLTSITTGDERRDDHLRSPDFFEVDKYPTMTFRSTGIRPEGDHVLVDGELTLKGVTKPLTLKVEANGIGPAFGGTRAGFSARGEINRREFGVNFEGIQDGVAVVSDKIELRLEVEAILQEDK